ncbi:DUF2853 family protein [Runella sp. MFBS21]|uniref:DUF2853 family protein n=1 Tax=Runella sp. MFBS21 TaxID=3034018 RepID=UPI0023F8759C|nr:DUF2853 family protein [Runella sp. MFBS21]MDF7821371.1 DUF2853 family protein [Runella sp. MFBS21]
MSAFTEVIEKSIEQLSNVGIGADEALLTAVAKGLGPSIYNQDSSLVASSDPEELARVKNNFLIGKLGLEDGPDLDAAIAETVATLKGINRKLRVVFYYLLVKKFGKEAIYS